MAIFNSKLLVYQRVKDVKRVDVHGQFLQETMDLFDLQVYIGCLIWISWRIQSSTETGKVWEGGIGPKEVTNFTNKDAAWGIEN